VRECLVNRCACVCGSLYVCVCERESVCVSVWSTGVRACVGVCVYVCVRERVRV